MNVWCGEKSVDVAPSPKSHSTEAMSPSASVELDESKLTISGDVPLKTDAVMTAVGD
jgi:hypothetical protein